MRTLIRRATVTALLVVSCIAPTASASADDSGLIVAPGSALFDVRLLPGQSESRLLTLTNTTDEAMDVYLTVDLDGGSSADHHFEDIVVHTDVSASCDATLADGGDPVPLAQIANAHQAIIAPNTSERICVTAAMPADIDSREAVTIVHFRFDALQHPSDLATTGAQVPYAFVLAAVLLAVTGGFLALRRREAADGMPIQPGSPMRDER